MSEQHMAAIGCTSCGKPLTDEERRYYEVRCEQCERDQLERWENWRRGAPDPELDRIYDAKEPRRVH